MPLFGAVSPILLLTFVGAFVAAVIMLRKNLMIGVTVFAAQYGVITQTVVGIIVCFVALVLQLEKKPYKSNLLDALETASLICCIATLQLGLLLVASSLGDAQYSGTTITAISVFLVVLHACYILAWFIYFVPEAWKMSGQVGQNAALLRRLGDKVLRRSRTRLSMDADSVPIQPTGRRGPRNQAEAVVGNSVTRLHNAWLMLKGFGRTPRGRARSKHQAATKDRRAYRDTAFHHATVCTDDGADAEGFMMETRKPDRRVTGVC